MDEIDEIESVLTGPVNSWFNNGQQLKFERLVRIARDAVRRAASAEKALLDLERTLEQEREALARGS
ncbi:MAG: hypothetical protein KGL39_05025 [Patescibacteria group bacterium]|nr:hypothetical protein [Patescibacteria group bacterium]